MEPSEAEFHPGTEEEAGVQMREAVGKRSPWKS